MLIQCTRVIKEISLALQAGVVKKSCYIFCKIMLHFLHQYVAPAAPGLQGHCFCGRGAPQWRAVGFLALRSSWPLLVGTARVGWISQLDFSIVFLNCISQLCLDAGLDAQYRPIFLGWLLCGGWLVRFSLAGWWVVGCWWWSRLARPLLVELLPQAASQCPVSQCPGCYRRRAAPTQNAEPSFLS